MDQSQRTLLDLSGCSRLLGISPVRLWWWARTGRFAPSSDDPVDAKRWRESDVLEWVLRNEPALVDRVPLSYWPDAVRPAKYLGGRAIKGAVAQYWRTGVGTVAVIWRIPDVAVTTDDALVNSLDDAQAILRVDNDFGGRGPNLTNLLRSRDRSYDVGWDDLSRVIGMPAPYWPRRLRIPELILSWRLGAPQAESPTIPDLDTGSLLRLAAAYEDNHSAARVLVNLARTTQYNTTSSALHDMETVGRLADDTTLVVATRPMPVPAADRDDLDPTVRRAGWLDILSRSDTLAASCVAELMSWDGGRDLPFSTAEEVSLETPAAIDWARRLRPTARTAAFMLFGRDVEGETLTDPATDAPVIRQQRTGEKAVLWLSIPQRLPTTSPLAELILDRPIWVRTEDGTVYPAPQDSYYGINWGYAGSGPASLALMIHRLLDDITAQAADDINGAPTTLERLTQVDFPKGTVLSRAQLEAARDGRWRPSGQDGDEAE